MASYRPNVNRAVTRKWAEARKVNYEAGWGDDEDDGYGEPSPPISHGQRSFTNPSALDTQRLSFDRGHQENRVFSAGANSPPDTFRGAPQARQYGQDQQPFDGRTSIDSRRSESRGSNTQFPPRKQSLGQSDISIPPQSARSVSPEASAKPLPFIRPADIYKRHLEEVQRQSEESSRSTEPQDDPKNQIQDHSRKRAPTLDSVTERNRQHFETVQRQQQAQFQPSPVETDLHAMPSIASASSRYTDRPDDISTASEYPSRSVSLTNTYQATQVAPQSQPSQHRLPSFSRASTFGSDMFQNEGYTAPQADIPPTIPSKEPAGTSSKSDQGYQSLVKNAFDAGNQRGRSPSEPESLLRSNTNSTSDISPIVSRTNMDNGSNLANIQEGSESQEFNPPQRIETNRRESPSPARHPVIGARSIPEPQSAITGPDTPSQATAFEAHMARPGPAILVSSRGPSTDVVPRLNQRNETQDTTGLSNERSASEEWAAWNSAKQEAHARHGIQDSNPPTPALDSGKSTPASDHPANLKADEDKSRGVAGLPSQRPSNLRDQSFRPAIPGGWQSSTSIQREDEQTHLTRPNLQNPDLRSDSTDSIPTAKPPGADWKSQYKTGPQATAFAAASAAGVALAGSFNGPAFASGGDSEVSSIAESHEGPTGRHHDPDLIHRDFASDSDPPIQSKESATHDFADTTPRAAQHQFPTPIKTTMPAIAPGRKESMRNDSPTKDSEHWWSDQEEDSASAPAPLRTSRLSIVGSKPSLSPIRRSQDDTADVDQLHSDIVKSLTPKSSNFEASTVSKQSPTRETATPFAAAALAMSPGKDKRTLQDQNSWEPLTDTSKSQSVAPEAASASISTLPIRSLTYEASVTNKPDPSKAHSHSTHDSGPSKEFAMFGDAPSLAPFNVDVQTTKEPAKDSPGISQRPESPTAHQAITVSRATLPIEPPPKDTPSLASPIKDLPSRNDSRPTTPRLSEPVSPVTPQTIRERTVRAFPEVMVSTAQIANMPSAQQRIKAYNDNREIYLQPVGQLENWLDALSSSHSDVVNTPYSTSTYVPSPKHSRQDSSTPGGRIQMRDDVQKLGATASKYGAKATILGKGLFSKGKEKLRNVSAGQKVAR